MRRRRARWLMNLIDDAYRKTGKVKILDLGGRENYWGLIPRGFLEEKKAHITIVNRGEEITPSDNGMFKCMEGDACDLNYLDDKSFDIVHSNSVIEHLGCWENMARFSSEAERLGHGLFIQTPYFWFPVEPHFIAPFYHWLPWPMRVSLHRRFKLGSRKKAHGIDQAVRIVEGAPILLDQKMYRYLFPSCEIIKERFLLFPKSMVAYRGIS